ncbi:Hypothetical predicted protein [Mytilus galloprovincialis]|uniref:Peptidase aspartic putative domain-containing protein n=1 Tax=Mytilus galloprovincialis TaxID=29158 RepID=A0A8B6C1N9_MYTGA|nr:Hypothetical predicted protein [Mytilus galloprovincialis]
MESKLKAVRRGHRGQVTKLLKTFDEIENNSDLDKDDVKLISDAIEQKQRTIVDLKENILDLTSEEDSIAEKLQIRPSRRGTIELSAFEDKEKNIRDLDTATVQQQTDKGEIVNINALLVPDIAVPLQNQTKYFTRNLPYLKDLKLAHLANNADSFEISLLIGADYYWGIVQDHVIRGHGPTAAASKIGYLLSGPVIRNGKKSLTSSVLLNVTSHHAEESEIEKFWNIELLEIRLTQQDDEESFVKTYQQDCIKFENERYSAKLPWKLDHPDLPSNIMISKAKTESTTRRLSREPHY